MPESEAECSHHVAVLAFPFGTHAAPLLNLTQRLAAAAPSTAKFSFFSTAKSNASLFGSKAASGGNHPSNIKAYDVEDGVPENHVFSGHPQEPVEMFIKVMPDNFKKAFEVAVSDAKKKISCIMSDAFFWFLADMADDMNVPWVPFWTAGATSLATHCYTDLIRKGLGGQDSAKSKDELISSIVPQLPQGLRLKDLPPEVVAGDANKESVFSIMLHKMGQSLTRATAITINTFDELDPTVTKDLKSKFKKFLTLGPFNLISSSSSSSPSDPNGCLEWLDGRDPASVAYISFGTVMIPPPNELAALAEGLEATGIHFIWSIPDRAKGNLPEGFLERASEKGKVVSWVPQSKILGHGAIGVFVTHGGWNSVLESVTGGVPMICRPFFGDQTLNARLVSQEWEIGVEAKDRVFSKGGVIESLRLVLKEEQGKKMRKKVGELKELAVKAVGDDGISTKNFATLLEIITGTAEN